MSALRPIRGCRARRLRASVRHVCGCSCGHGGRFAPRLRDFPAGERYRRAAGRHESRRMPDSRSMRGIGFEPCRADGRIRDLRANRVVAREGRRDAPDVFPALRKEGGEARRGRASPRNENFRNPRLTENRPAARPRRFVGTDGTARQPEQESRFASHSRREDDPKGPKTPGGSAAGRPAECSEAANAEFFEASDSARGSVPGMRMAVAGFVRGSEPLLGRARAVSAALPTGPQELERP